MKPRVLGAERVLVSEPVEQRPGERSSHRTRSHSVDPASRFRSTRLRTFQLPIQKSKSLAPLFVFVALMIKPPNVDSMPAL